MHSLIRACRGALVALFALGLALALVPSPAARAATGWAATGSLASSRSNLTATTLADGRVLVAGGYSNPAARATAEIYDPVTGQWSATGTMAVARYSHTATLLPGGKVLVAGGYASGQNLASAEVYDPTTGQWTRVGDLAQDRSWHTATLLPGGKVLIVGGHGSTGTTSSAELYDPATGEWSAAADTATHHDAHSAILLPGGMVLVAGGFNGNRTAELYDPATDRWSSAGQMNAARALTGITVLTAGPHAGKVLVVGGWNGVSLSSAELYDPQTNGWSAAGAMGTAREGHAATTLASGKVLVIGGLVGSQVVATTAELYDPETGAWSNAPAMSGGRAYHAAITLDDGSVLAIGGQSGGGAALTTVERYTPARPVVRLSETSLAFGPQPVGTTSAARAVTLSNDGDEALRLGAITTAGPFAHATGCGTRLAPGASCTIEVTFVPAAAGAQTGALTIASDAAGSPHTVSLTGAGTAPAVTLAPASLDFGAREVGAAGPARVVGLTNSGNAPLAIGTIAASGDFAQSNDCGASLAPGASCAIAVTFTPAAAGPRGGTLTITDSAIGSPRNVSLNGTGTVMAPPAPPAPTVYALALSASGPGAVTASAPGPHAPGAVVALTATPAPDAVFLGWTVDGAPAGWANPLTITIGADHAVVAGFAPRPTYRDVDGETPYAGAIGQLAARGIIRGYQDGRFGPGDRTLRAQMAALIARAMGWEGEDRGNPFPDQGTVDAALWRNVGTLAHYNVARGYADGTYKPTENVAYAQTISFITRAMLARGYWVQQPDNPALYPNVPANSGHRQDIATFVHYAGALPGTSRTTERWSFWSQPSTRSWFAGALWQALDAHFGQDRVP